MASKKIEDVDDQDALDLIKHFSTITYFVQQTDHDIAAKALEICKKLISLDYNYCAISNHHGKLSPNYPRELLIIDKNNSCCLEGSNKKNTYCKNISDLMEKARKARCRTRLPVPVILFKDKYICRSATLAGNPELYCRTSLDYLFARGGRTIMNDEGMMAEFTYELEDVVQFCRDNLTLKDWDLVDKARRFDIQLLESLKIDTIYDLMLENKKVKYGFYVTSSEKIDKEKRYENFKLLSLPYPGCEFFKDYRDNNYVSAKLFFDWTQSFVDANLQIPTEPIPGLNIEWKEYKEWDLRTLTQNYIKLILHHLKENNTGYLIHCISGWDRTPLFISLLRLSLWADGLIHPTLTPHQILYLTVAYDWFFFGHDLQDRSKKGEDIFFFCFDFLKHLVNDEFSLAPRSPSPDLSDSEFEKVDMKDLKQSSSPTNKTESKHHSPPEEKTELKDESFNGNDFILLEGGNISNNSNNSKSSSSSSENGNSPPSKMSATKKTSPVAVPARQGQEGTSPALSIGSWQYISTTGSFRDRFLDKCFDYEPPLNPKTTDASDTNDSSTTHTDDDCFIYNQILPDSMILRKDKLNRVRFLFYQAYCQSAGMKFKEGEFGISTLIGNFAEKVGIITSQKPTES